MKLGINAYSQASCGLPWCLSSKASTCNAGVTGSIPGLRRFPGERNGNPLQYSCMGNPMDRGAWRAIVHGITKNRTQLSDWSCVQFTSSPYSKFVYLPKTVILIPGLPWWLSGKEPTCQCRRHRFNPWSGKTLHAKGQLRLCATTIEPVFQSAGAATTKAYILYSLCFARREATTVTSPCTATRVVPTRLN